MKAASFLHGSCAAWENGAVLLTGLSGSGKSDLLLRLVDAGFDLVADDQVVISPTTHAEYIASPPPTLAGLIEVRGLGILRLPYREAIPLRLHVALDFSPQTPRLPPETRHEQTGVWSLTLDPRRAGAVAIIRAALRCASGTYELMTGINGDTIICQPFSSRPQSG